MRVFGLIGFPLTHSFSKKYFTAKFLELRLHDSTVYENFELQDISELKSLLDSNRDITGLNVTIPYKEKVLPFLDEIDPLAVRIGAVNTIKITRVESGKIIRLKGFNTDVTGFDKSIVPFLKMNSSGALILGTGGASKAVSYVLQQKNIPFLFVSRTPQNISIGYDQITAEVLMQYPIVINTTPLGTYPEIEAFPPIPYHFLGPRNLLFDLIYNPPVTEFMKKGMQYGAIVSNGSEMLKIQAEAAWEIWNV